MSIINVKDLSYFYPRQDHPALHKVNLQIKKGEIWAVIGRSGCGKSTLVRALSRLVPDFYGGSLSGEIILQQRSLREWSNHELYRQMGVVTQDAEHSMIFSAVKRDIAFGLENLGLSNCEMNLRVAKVLDYFKLNTFGNRSINHLSGGEKQKAALAGIVAMKPQILILDEPTAQLDPAASRDFFQLIKQLHKELAITIIIVEQKLEQIFALADKVAVMEKGQIIFTGTPAEQIKWAAEHKYPLVPASAKDAELENIMPGQMKERKNAFSPLTDTVLVSNADDILVSIQGLNYSYSAETPAINNVDLQLLRGQFAALIGDNGAGKSSLLKIMLGLLKAESGQLNVAGHQGKSLVPRLVGQVVAYLPQSLDHFFMTDSVLEDVKLAVKQQSEAEKTARCWLEKLNVIKYLNCDPRSLSTGEKQRVALAAIIAGDPCLILLDEPTRGLDIMQKRELGQILMQLAQQGKTVLIAAHDLEFVNRYAHRVLVMHQGRIMSDQARSQASTEVICQTG